MRKRNKTADIPRALTIAGSDSGGGAGVQADLKTFAMFGVHGMSAITALTAQNTREVTGIMAMEPSFVLKQIDSAYLDIGFDSVKTGMLHDGEIIRSIADYLKKRRIINIVVDPVMISKSGAPLLERTAIEALKNDLLPLSRVVTPNAAEARALSGMRNISSMAQARHAARKISEFGSEVVIVKGGHLQNHDESTDVVYWRSRKAFSYLRSPRLNVKSTHGTGCVFASAIAAELAKGSELREALEIAKLFVTKAIMNSFNIGHGSGPVNPTGEVVKLAERYAVIENVIEAVKILENNGSAISKLMPELRMNLGMAVSGARDNQDIAAIPGRITSVGDQVRALAAPEFGASRHIANSILAALQFNKDSKAAMNIKYDPKLVRLCTKLGMSVSSYDRGLEPNDIRRKEGSSTFWGASVAIAKSRTFPQVIYHKGDLGKEPMMVLLGKDAISVANSAVKLGRGI